MFDFFYFLNEKHAIIKSLNYDGIGQGGGGLGMYKKKFKV